MVVSQTDKTTVRILAKVLLTLSPAVVGMLAGSFSHKQDLSTGVGIFALFIVGIPLVLIVGSVGSIIIRKRPNADKESVYMYLAPAILTWLYGLALFW